MVALLALAGTLAAQDQVKPAAVPELPKLPPGIRWTIELSAPPSAPPVIGGDRVFVAALPGQVIAYRLSDNQQLWRQPLAPEQPVAPDGDRVFIAAGEAVHALNAADGSLLWRQPTGTLTAPLLAKDGWVIAASASKLYALRATDGEIIWSVDHTLQRQRAAISGDYLFLPLASGAVRAVDLSSGATRWDWRVAGAPAEPLVVGDRLYVGATDKHFYSVNIKNGETDWKWWVGAEVRARAASDGERIYYLGLDNLVRAVGRNGGSQRWQYGVRFRPFEGPVVVGTTIVLAGSSPDVVLLNVQTGDPVGKISFPDRLELAPAIGTLPDGIVVAGFTGALTETWKMWLASPDMAAASK
jgi:outer membrane protein assembly factor BamB